MSRGCGVQFDPATSSERHVLNCARFLVGLFGWFQRKMESKATISGTVPRILPAASREAATGRGRSRRLLHGSRVAMGGSIRMISKEEKTVSCRTNRGRFAVGGGGWGMGGGGWEVRGGHGADMAVPYRDRLIPAWPELRRRQKWAQWRLRLRSGVLGCGPFWTFGSVFPFCHVERSTCSKGDGIGHIQMQQKWKGCQSRRECLKLSPQHRLIPIAFPSR